MVQTQKCKWINFSKKTRRSTPYTAGFCVCTSMSVLLIVGPKRTLAASNAAPWWVTVSMPTGQTDRQTPVRYITLSAGRGRRNNGEWQVPVTSYDVRACCSIDKCKALSLIVHCADISHPAKSWDTHQRWTDLLVQEFFRQVSESIRGNWTGVGWIRG